MTDASAPPPPTSPAGTRPATPPWAPFLILVLAALAHGGVLQAGFVGDDHLVRTDARVLGGPGEVPRLLVDGTLRTEDAGEVWRPLTLSTLALQAPLSRGEAGNLAPFGPHLVGLLLHMLAAWLFFLVLVRLLPGGPAPAILGAALFAVHPLHTGTISLLLGRTEVLCTVFLLLAALATLRVRAGDLVALLPVALCGLLALLSSELALAPLFCLPLLRGAGAPTLERRHTLLLLGSVLLPALLFLVLWPGPASGAPDLPPQDLLDRALLGAAGAVRLGLRALLPATLVPDHSDEADPVSGFDLDGGLLFAAIAAGAVLLLALFRLISKERAPVAAALGFVVVFGVAGGALGAPGYALESRMGYVVLLPLFGALGMLLHRLRPALDRPVALVLAAAPVLVLALLARAHARVYEDDDHLIRYTLGSIGLGEEGDVIGVRPDHVRLLIRQAGRMRRAAEQLRLQAAELPAELRRGVPNPEVFAMQQDARALLGKAHTLVSRAEGTPNGPRLWTFWREAGHIARAEGNSRAATINWNRALRTHPELASLIDQPDLGPDEILEKLSPRARRAGAELLLAIGLLQTGPDDMDLRRQSLEALSIAARFAPTDPEVRYQIGHKLVSERRYRDATRHLEAAARYAAPGPRRQTFLEAWREAARLGPELAEKKIEEAERVLSTPEVPGDRYQRAAFLYRDAHEADPGNLRAGLEAARLLGTYLGNYREAHAILASLEGALAEGRADVPEEAAARIRDVRAQLEQARAREDREAAEEEARAPEHGGPGDDG